MRCSLIQADEADCYKHLLVELNTGSCVNFLEHLLCDAAKRIDIRALNKDDPFSEILSEAG